MFVSLLILAFNALSASACATTSSSVGACDGTSLTTTYFTSGVCDSKTLVSEFCGATTDEFATTDEVDQTTAYTTLCTDGLVTTIYTYVYYVSDSSTSQSYAGYETIALVSFAESVNSQWGLLMGSLIALLF